MGTANPSNWKLQRSFPLRLSLDGFWWISGSAALSAACQCLESHSISNTQTVKMCLFFMDYGAIDGRWGRVTLPSVALLDSSVILPVRVPSLWKENRAEQKDRQNFWQEPHCHWSSVGPALSAVRIVWNLSPGSVFHSLHSPA